MAWVDVFDAKDDNTRDGMVFDAMACAGAVARVLEYLVL